MSYVMSVLSGYSELFDSSSILSSIWETCETSSSSDDSRVERFGCCLWNLSIWLLVSLSLEFSSSYSFSLLLSIFEFVSSTPFGRSLGFLRERGFAGIYLSRVTFEFTCEGVFSGFSLFLFLLLVRYYLLTYEGIYSIILLFNDLNFF